MTITSRFYSKKELALLYFPDSEPRIARAHLMRWIANCKPLCAALHETHYDPKAKYFSPKQLKLVLEYLGEP